MTESKAFLRGHTRAPPRIRTDPTYSFVTDRLRLIPASFAQIPPSTPLRIPCFRGSSKRTRRFLSRRGSCIRALPWSRQLLRTQRCDCLLLDRHCFKFQHRVRRSDEREGGGARISEERGGARSEEERRTGCGTWGAALELRTKHHRSPSSRT